MSIPSAAARQRLGKHVPTAKNPCNIRRIFEGVFSFAIRVLSNECLWVSLFILLSLLGKNSVKTFQRKRRNIEVVIFYSVSVVWKKSRRLVLPRTTCYFIRKDYIIIAFASAWRIITKFDMNIMYLPAMNDTNMEVASNWKSHIGFTQSSYAAIRQIKFHIRSSVSCGVEWRIVLFLKKYFHLKFQNPTLRVSTIATAPKVREASMLVPFMAGWYTMFISSFL
jgi:hypothetical protein